MNLKGQIVHLAVIRRVGGLEASAGEGRAEKSVIRRVGGLEVRERDEARAQIVIRRVGGLEVPEHFPVRFP